MKNRRWSCIFHVIGFFLLFIVSIYIAERIFFSNQGLSGVWNAVQNDDDQINVLIMGNSHAYTSFDAEVLSEALDKNVQVLGTGAQYMEMTYENLRIVLEYKKPEYIILEAYSPILNTREELQGEGRGKLLRNFDGVENYFYKARAITQTLKWNNIPEGIYQLFRPTNMWTRWDFKSNHRMPSDRQGFTGRDEYLNANINVATIQEECYNNYQMGITERGKVPEYNREALEAFLKLTAQENIPVWICKAPTLNSTISSYLKEIEDICSEYSNVQYIEDMHFYMTEMGLEENDFYDNGHLNRRGAEKFTQYYGNIMAERMNIVEDWGNVFAYREESVERADDGNFLYKMENYSEDCLYKFQLYVDGEVADLQEYSAENTYVSEYDVRELDEHDLYCSMIPESDADMGDKSENRIKLAFMKESEGDIE